MAIKRNLVLGGSGTIGKALCEYLVAKGEKVINLDIKEGNDLRVISLDKYKNVDFVWFLAWEVGGAKFIMNKENSYKILDSNLRICINVFDFLNKYNLPFLFTSSQLAATDNTYGLTKLIGEEYVQSLNNGKIVRLWNVYSWEEPSEKSHFIPDLIIKAYKNKVIDLMTDGKEERQLIYIDDCVRNLVLIRELNGKMFHLTNNKWISVAEIAQKIANIFNAKIKLNEHSGYQCKVEPNKTHKLFNFEVNIDEGIEKVIKKAKNYLNSIK